MRIAGMHKLSLLDYPGLTACTLFAPGCNLRCPYCHNASLVLPSDARDDLPLEEVLDFLAKRRGLLEGVCISGGEASLQPDLEDFIRALRALGYKVKLDTNGCFPERLAALLEAGLLDYVAMDLKNVPERYAETVGLEGFDPACILESMRLLKASGPDYELRTTVLKNFHPPATLRALAELALGAPRYALQNYCPDGDILAFRAPGAAPLRGYGREELHALLPELQAINPALILRAL